ncbi:MAG TPA: T9SS type A sorting domain-containing protein [Bacteroidia bacterium]|nr:T9SS type A sorting domain-containing protein [Bacteroidia bacterium]
MKKITCLVLLFLSSHVLCSQTVLYSENFENLTNTFTLNGTAVNSTATGENFWIVNNEFSGGSASTVCLGFPVTFSVPNTPSQPGTYAGNPYSKYLHTLSVAANTSGINNCCFLAADGLCANPENYFASMTNDISTTGYTNVQLSFGWLCDGSNNNYGEVYYSIDGGSTWIQQSLPLQKYFGQGNWTTQNITNAAFDNQATLRFGFRFANQITTTAQDPGFAIDEIIISGNQNVVLPIAAFTASNVSLCEKSVVDFTNLSSNATSYLWLFPGGLPATSTDTNPTGIYYANYGTYSVTLIATNANGSDTLVFPNYITINQNPPAPVITLNGNLLISTPAISYQWFLNNTPIPGGVNQVQPLTSVGSYYVLITDSNGCQSASNLLVVSGIEQTSPSQNFNIYTNTNHELIIDNIGLLNEPFQVSICDIEGRLVMQSTINTTTQARINIASLTEGVYLTTIYNAWSQTVLKFVIK